MVKLTYSGEEKRSMQMKKDGKKTIMIIALISIFICGCPGIYFLLQGSKSFLTSVGTISSIEDLLYDMGVGFINGGWQVCLSGLLILIPFILMFIAVLSRKKKKAEVVKAEPSGVSKDDPIPPTR
jgi:hypothetical protein